MNIIYIIFLFIMIISCEVNKSKSQSKINKKKIEISFKDQLSRKINLEKPAENIVMIPKPGTSILIAIDGGVKRLRGINPSSKIAAEGGILGEFFPNVKKIPTNVVTDNFVPNMEELLKINPDLVFQWGYGKYKKYINEMEKLGLKVAAFQWNTNPELISGWIMLIGNSIGKLKKAKKFIKWREELFKKFNKNISEISKKYRPRTLAFRYYTNQYKVAPILSMDVLNINYPNETKTSSDYWSDKIVNIEYILKWDPEIIFLSNFDEVVEPDDVYNNELLSGLSAVKNKRVYKIPLGGYRWSPPNHETPLAWMWMSMLLYPDYFNFDLRKEIKTWYKIMYNKFPTDKQINDVLHIKINKGSKYYEKFIN